MIFLYWNIRLFRQERQSSSGDVTFIYFLPHIRAENSLDLKYEYEKWLFVARKNPSRFTKVIVGRFAQFFFGCFSRTQRKSVARSIRWGGSSSSHRSIVVSLLGLWKRARQHDGWCVHEKRAKIPRLWGFFLLFFIVAHCRVSTSTYLSSRILFFFVFFVFWCEVGSLTHNFPPLPRLKIVYTKII